MLASLNRELHENILLINSNKWFPWTLAYSIEMNAYHMQLGKHGKDIHI